MCLLWLYFCTFSSVPLIYVFVLLPKSCQFDCYSFIACLEIRLCADSNFCLLSHVLLLTFYLEITLGLRKCCKTGTKTPPDLHLVSPNHSTFRNHITMMYTKLTLIQCFHLTADFASFPLTFLFASIIESMVPPCI